MNQYIEDKNYKVGFASASEVFDAPKGDCTEHSVLMSAACKSAGIPSRVIAGIVGEKDKFFYHMWVEVWIGEWVEMDPTLNQTLVNERHIKLADGILSEDGLFNMTIAIVQWINNIKIELVNE